VGIDIDLGRTAVGSRERLTVSLKKDGLPWDLTAGTVTLTFTRPGRTSSFDRTMLPSNPSAGVFFYDRTEADLDVRGWWLLGITVVDGGLVYIYPNEISLYAS
jgi:hypothetical protein